MIRRVATVALLCCVLTIRLAAWGGAGHHVIARIAWSQMTPAAKQLVADLIGDEDFVQISTWADSVRGNRPETYNWHFVNIPYAAARYDPVRDCPPTDRGDCVIAAIERARAEIVTPGRSREARAESLKFLVHFVGDMHQPLHNIGNNDRGGNDVGTVVEGFVPAEGRGQPNLHAVWDSTLIGLRSPDEAATAARLIARLAAEPLDDPADIDVARWSLEARDVAVKYVYAYRGFEPGAAPATAASIDAAYQRAAGPVTDTQLMRGGVRLARILNAAAAVVAARSTASR